ncbi:hypothetical protein [Amphritea balenae]|uniref:Uncharacterized protein n=1 Tax=Amphritea balenae TaxID=452629 RepID=A0A3P1SVT6_9GAMM|nr:hypothetical protein [Amphritea balenae]RRD01322.1 hypothetical protein EHS89_01815 [Amphritea balenae]GGK58143.1 hypothetical protein GCM10007941_05330 [Amphritea balenae]
MEKKEIMAIRDAAVSIMEQYPEHSYLLLKIALKYKPDGQRIQRKLIASERRLIERMPYKGQVISARTDGLLARINSIFNGVILAKYYKVPFSFTWVNDARVTRIAHGSVDGEIPSFISRAFMSGYYADESDMKRCSLPFVSNENTNGVAGKTIKSIVSRDLFSHYLNEYMNVVPTERLDLSDNSEALVSYSGVFNQFFSRSIKKRFKKIKKSCSWSESIAIHYRGGDVIYGLNRFGRFIRKRTLSLPVVENIINDNKEKSIIVFGTPVGETLKELYYLKNKYSNVKLSVDIIGNESTHSPEATLYDAYMMSICKRVYCAGDSNMTIFAENVGDVEIIIPSKDYEISVFKAVLSTDEFASYSALQKSFIYSNMLVLLIETGEALFEEIDPFLVRIYDLDPIHKHVLQFRYLYAIKHSKAELAKEMKEALGRADEDFNSLKERLPPQLVSLLSF